jgi:hypothetical protein
MKKPVWVDHLALKRRTVPADPYEAEAWLDELSRFLRDQGYDLADWLAAAIERRRLINTSFESELGLLHGEAGAPSIKDRPRSDPERRRRVGIAVDAHRYVEKIAEGKQVPWKKIARAIGFKGNPNDLRKLHHEYYDEKEDMVRQLTQEP